MGRYSHPGIEEREDIMVRWRDHEGVSRIAREVGRDKSTVSREIARNGWAASASPGCVYRASTAQARADARRLACRRPRALGDPARRSLVASPIRDRHWSPRAGGGQDARRGVVRGGQRQHHPPRRRLRGAGLRAARLAVHAREACPYRRHRRGDGGRGGNALAFICS